MKSVAIIPARGGSKRISGKNIKNFLGKPIISYPIKACQKSKLFSSIIVSTDDTKIAEVAEKYGAIVPFMRSKKNSDDHATTGDVLLEVLQQLQKFEKLPEYVCVVYPTTPLLTTDLLKAAFNKIKKFKQSTVLPVSQFDFPIQFAMKIKKNGISYANRHTERLRSQDMEVHFHDTGMFYWINVKDFLKQKKIIMKKTGWVMVDTLSSQDINDMSDWKLAEMKYRLIHG